MSEDVATLQKLNDNLRLLPAPLQNFSFLWFFFSILSEECVIEVADNSKLEGEFRFLFDTNPTYNPLFRYFQNGSELSGRLRHWYLQTLVSSIRKVDHWNKHFFLFLTKSTKLGFFSRSEPKFYNLVREKQSSLWGRRLIFLIYWQATCIQHRLYKLIVHKL